MREGEVIIIGTAHVSPTSIQEVEKIIENERPDAVAVELCKKRYKALMGELEWVPIVDVIKRGEVHLLLFQIILSYFQRKVGREFGVKPGDEMLAAIKKAKEIGADVFLIDRDASITFRRMWSLMSFFEKIKMFFQIIRGIFIKDKLDIDKILKEKRTLEKLIYDFKKISPSAAKVLIDERDAYMAANLLKLKKKYNKIIAVVGAGHERGIKKFLDNPLAIPEINKLLEVKKKKIKVFHLLFVLFLIFLIFLFFKIPKQIFFEAFLCWFLINGILAAIGALIARAHPLSILTAFFCAWFTSLNPFIAAGWITGIVETWIRKPSIKDFKDILKTEKFSDLLNNKLFRILLVVALTNLGSTIGTFLAAYLIIKMFGASFWKFEIL